MRVSQIIEGNGTPTCVRYADKVACKIFGSIGLSI
jgi:hypothetical protein